MIDASCFLKVYSLSLKISKTFRSDQRPLIIIYQLLNTIPNILLFSCLTYDNTKRLGLLIA